MRPANITIRERDAEVELKKAQAKEKLMQQEADMERIKIEKLKALEYLLTSDVIDENSTSIGESQKCKPAFDESELATIKGKIFEIIHKL